MIDTIQSATKKMSSNLSTTLDNDVQFEKVNPDLDTKIPTRATPFSACYDLCSAERKPITIKPGQRSPLIKTNIRSSFPDHMCVQFIPRSGLAYKYGIHVMAGRIDADYRGEWCVILYNSDTEKEFVVGYGDRIAQFEFAYVLHPKLEWGKVIDDTKRSSGGFGSTGV